jgi:thiamine biosynthesis lipoprotein
LLDDTFPTMGTFARVVRDADGGFDVARLFAEIERRLSRFDPDSDLSRLNADPRFSVPVAPLLRGAVGAALRAARLTGGLVDPTLLGAMRRFGYGESRARVEPPSVLHALRSAPPRRPARPDPAARWRAVEVDERAGLIRRPPGIGLDLGGSVKGWTADLLATRLALHGRCAVDCGGDLRVLARRAAPWEVRVRHPLSGEVAYTFHVHAGGVATSGIDARLWERHGGFAHHLIDPASRTPAWTGLISATALAPTALEAEALAKAALLSGPAAGRALLRSRAGGVLIHDGGAVEPVDGSPRRRRRSLSSPGSSLPRAVR